MRRLAAAMTLLAGLLCPWESTSASTPLVWELGTRYAHQKPDRQPLGRGAVKFSLPGWDCIISTPSPGLDEQRPEEQRMISCASKVRGAGTIITTAGCRLGVRGERHATNVDVISEGLESSGMFVLCHD